MTFKILVAFTILAVTNAVVYPTYHQPAVYKTYTPVVKHVEVEAPAKYDFSYHIQDEHTGDVKSQEESRDGDVVRGSYSLIDPDGYKRTVEYTADEHGGFNAVVNREPLGHAIKKVAAPVAKVVAAPIYHGYSHY